MTTPPVGAHDVVGVESSAETDKTSFLKHSKNAFEIAQLMGESSKLPKS